jgi:hypothetical protein
MTLFCVHLVIYQPQTAGQVVWSVKAGGMDRPSHTKSHPAGSLSSRQQGGPPCWTSPLAFGPHWSKLPTYIHQSYCKKLSNFSMHENSHYGVYGNNYSAQLMMDLCNSLSWSPAFFPKDFPSGLFGDFFSSKLLSISPLPLFFNEFLFVDSVPDPGGKMAPKNEQIFCF